MTEEQTAKKKGLGPLAWVAIGCGALIVVVLLMMSAGVWFAGKKFKEVAEDFEENPAKTTAEMMVKMNPELDLVESDEEEGTITIRVKETGEVATFDYSDIKEGKISFESSEGRIAFDATGQEEGGVFTVETEEGKSQWGAVGAPEDLPDWLPAYPNVEAIQTTYTEEKEGSRSGTFGFQSSDPPGEILAFYRERLEAAGLTVEETTTTEGGTVKGGSLSAVDDASERQATVTVTVQGEDCNVGIFYSDSRG